jgi:hypothetical protein
VSFGMALSLPVSLSVHVLRLQCCVVLSLARALVFKCVCLSVCLSVDAMEASGADGNGVCGRVCQRKMAELASKKGGGGGGDDAAAKKAAFLKEAEEAVRRAAQSEADRKSAVQNSEVSSTCPLPLSSLREIRVHGPETLTPESLTPESIRLQPSLIPFPLICERREMEGTSAALSANACTRACSRTRHAWHSRMWRRAAGE